MALSTQEQADIKRQVQNFGAVSTADAQAFIGIFKENDPNSTATAADITKFSAQQVQIAELQARFAAGESAEDINAPEDETTTTTQTPGVLAAPLDDQAEIVARLVNQFNAGSLGPDTSRLISALASELGLSRDQIIGSSGILQRILPLIQTKLAEFTALAPTGQTPSEEQEEDVPPPVIPPPVVDTGLGGTAQERLDRLFQQSATPTGRGNIFRDFGAAQGGTPLQRQVRGGGFDPLSAAFVLRQATDPSFGDTSGGEFIGPNQNSFRDFLGSSPQRFNTEQIRNAFQSLAPLFSGGQLSPLDEARRDFVSGAGQNLATEFFSSQVNPLFRGSIGGAVGRRFGAQRDVDPLGDPFGGFLTRQGF